MTQSSMPASTQRYDVSVDQMDPFGNLTNELNLTIYGSDRKYSQFLVK